MKKQSNEQTVERAAGYYLAGRRLEDEGRFDEAWKLFEASAALYRKAGRSEDAEYIENRSREQGYTR